MARGACSACTRGSPAPDTFVVLALAVPGIAEGRCATWLCGGSAMAPVFAALRQTGAPMRRMSTATAAPAALVTPGMVTGVVLGLYVGALGSRVLQARNGTLPDDLDGPLATLTAAKAIKKFCTPASPVAAPESAGHSHGAGSAALDAAVAAPLEGEPAAGSPEALELIASLQTICNRLGRVQVETTRG